MQGVFAKYGCTACHPGVNPSLDLRSGKAYAQIVGVQAVEDPPLVRVVAGDAKCTACHPLSYPYLDLRPGRSYAFKPPAMLELMMLGGGSSTRLAGW